MRQIKTVNELLKGKDISWKEKAAIRGLNASVPGAMVIMDNIFSTINAKMAAFELENGRAMTKDEAKAITKDLMLDQFPNIKKNLKLFSGRTAIDKMRGMLSGLIGAQIKDSAKDEKNQASDK